MKHVKKAISVGISALLVLSLAACSSPGTGAAGSAASQGSAASDQAGSKVIRIASQSPSTEFANGGSTALGISTNYFMDTIKERSNGQITCELYPDGQLASSSDDIIGGLQNGSFECAIFNNGGWSDYTSGFAAINVPYLYFDYDEAYAVLDSSIGDAMKAQVTKDTSLIPVAFFDIGFRHITNDKREIKSPADIKGLKIRSMPDDIQIAALKALGASVTPLSYSELFTALQQKLVDGEENPISNIISEKFYEVQPYMTLTGHSFTISTMTFNPDFFNSLTADQQKLVREVAIEAQNKGREATPEIESNGLKFLKEHGVKVYEPTEQERQAFQNAAKSSWSKVEQVMGKDNFDALTKFVTDYRASHK